MNVHRLHDEDYDGIVLKIPSFFIKLNKLEPAIEALREAMEAAEFSVMMPDHVRNLSELDGWEEKAKMVQEAKREEKERWEKRLKDEEERKENLANHIWLPINKRDIKHAVEGYKMKMGDKIWKYTEIYTQKGLKAEFKRAFDDFFNKTNKEEALEFFKENGFYSLLAFLHDAPEHLVNFKTASVYIDSYSNLSVKMDFPTIEVYNRGKRNKQDLYYSQAFLKIKDGRYYIETKLLEGGGTVTDESPNGGTSTGYRRYLDDYELEGLKFVKK